MFLLKLWYLLCFILLITGLYHFCLSQNFSVNFKKSDSKSDSKSDFRFSACFRTSEYLDEEKRDGFVVPSKLLQKVYRGLKKNFDGKITELLSDLRENATFERLVQKVSSKFANLEGKIESRLNEIRSELEKHFEQSVPFEELIRKDTGYLKNDLACYPADDRLLHYLGVLGGMRYRLYAYSSKPSFNVPNMLIDNRFKDRSGLRMLKTLVNFCPDNRVNTSAFQTLNECMNDCLLRTGRRSFCEYQFGDNERVYLNNTKRDLAYEKRCYDECVSNYCFLHSYLTVNSHSRIEKAVVVIESYKGSIFLFLIQFVSLIFLFTRSSVYYLLTESSGAPVKFLCKVFANRRFIGPLLRRTNWLLLALCCISALLISANILWIYLQSLNAPVKSAFSNFSFLPETFSIVICVPVQLNLNRTKELALGKNESMLAKYSFAEIENLTNNDLEIVLKKVYLKKDEQQEIKLRISEKVYFKSTRLASLNMSFLSRCFRTEFPAFSTVIYRDLLITSDLILQLDEICYYRSELSPGSYAHGQVESFCQVYLLDDFKQFLWTTFQHQNVYQVYRKRIKKTRSFLQKNCTDYGIVYGEQGCTCRQSCFERCINKGFLQKYGNLSIEGTVIDRDEFEASSLSKIYFKETSDRNLTVACERQFVLDDCYDSFFETSYRRLNENPSQVVEINLDFENLEENEFETTLSKLLIDFLNIIVLFFGTNINILIVCIAARSSNRLKVNRKWAKLFVTLCCTVGFLLHSVMVYLSIVKAPLVSSGYYDKTPFIFYPNLAFCFDYRTSNIDRNFKLTGAYLDGLTSHLTPAKVFERIAFVNATNDINYLSFGLSADCQNCSSRLPVITYFTKAKKCFLLELDGLRHEEYEFLNRDDPYPLKIFFRKQTMKSVERIELKSVPGNLQKSFVFEIAAKHSFFGERKRKYQIKSEVLSIAQTDEFRSILFLLSSDFQDTKAYLRRIAEKFKTTHHFSTLNLNLKQDLFDYEINDEIFGQFYEQRKDLFDNSYSDETSRKLFGNYVQLFTVDAADDEADLEFGPVYHDKMTRIENAEGIAKLLISLLNALSFWFDICILDFHFYFVLPFRLFTRLLVWPQRMLCRLKSYLKKKTNLYGNLTVEPPSFFANLLLIFRWPQTTTIELECD